MAALLHFVRRREDYSRIHVECTLQDRTRTENWRTGLWRTGFGGKNWETCSTFVARVPARKSSTVSRDSTGGVSRAMHFKLQRHTTFRPYISSSSASSSAAAAAADVNAHPAIAVAPSNTICDSNRLLSLLWMALSAKAFSDNALSVWYSLSYYCRSVEPIVKAELFDVRITSRPI